MQWLPSRLFTLGLAVAVCSATMIGAQPPPAPPAAPADAAAQGVAPAAPPADVPPPAAVPPAAPAPAGPGGAPASVPPPQPANRVGTLPSASRAAAPPPAPPPEDDKLITMNFQDIDLDALVKFISEITGRNFILDDRVKGKVTIISPGKISVDEAYAVFNSVLQVKGFTTVPSGAVIKILPSQEAKSSTVETFFPGKQASDGDEFVTKLIKLENVDVNNMLGIIQPLVSANGLLAAYTATNTMIIIDSGSNIDRISSILHELDIKDRERGIDVVRLNYAFATEIAATLAQVLEDPANSAPAVAAGVPPRPAAAGAAARRAQGAAPGAAAAAPVSGGAGVTAYKIIPDERTNALILVANPLEMRRIKDLIVRLDVPLPFGTGRTHVYYLKYANVFEIVPVLSDLVGGQGVGGLSSGLLGRGLSGSTGFRGGRLGQRGGLGGVGQNLGGGSGFNSQFGGGGFGGGGFGGGGGLGGGGAAGSLRGGGLGGGLAGGPGGAGSVQSIVGGGGGQFEGLVRITADPSTNALIINASPQDYETLKQVILQLDVRRRQVYVEAIIMEVRLDTTRALGIELQGAAGTGNGVLIGRTNFRNLNTALTNPAGITGLIAAAASNQTIRLPDGTVVPAQALLITASEVNNDVNILSAPNVLTTDNQEAEIVVGQNVPFIASTSTSETNLGNVFNTVERRDVGITLRITPQISEGGMVRLNVFEEVSALTVNALINASQLGPVTTIRSATTSVVVRDKQTVVIGGLISDDTSNQEQSIPFISDIPVLGNLFRQTQGMRQKINLLIFLTPHIIRDSREHRDKSIQERDKLKSFMEEQGIRYRKRKILDNPSWTPDVSGDRPETEEGESANKGATIYSPPPLPPSGGAVPGARASTEPEPLAAADLPPPAYDEIDAPVPPPPVVSRFVLLAAYSEQGSPPPGLQSNSGLLAVELPQSSPLVSFFQPGRQYRFTSDRFDGYYRVLEAYPSQQQAFLVYPEGLPVDPSKGDFLHWRSLDDATSTDVSAWTALH
jgi:general secretion pathway protein D